METEKSGNRIAMDLQIAKAKKLELEKNVITFLERIKDRGDWQRLEWFYLCAIDRMPLAEMERMEQADYTIPQIRKERIDFLKKVYVGLEPVYQTVEELKGEVQGACEESRRTKELLSLNLEKILEEQKELSKEAIQSKEEVIGHLKEKIKDLEQTNRRLEENVKTLEQKTLEHEVAQIPSAIEERKEEHAEEPEAQQRNGSMKEALRKIKRLFREDDEALVIKHFLKNDAYTEEQKNFLIDCLEEGYSFEEVSTFASEHFSLAVMKRLKELKRPDQREG